MRKGAYHPIRLAQWCNCGKTLMGIDTKKNMREAGKRLLCIVLSFAVCIFSLLNFEYDSYAVEQSGADMTESTGEQQLEEFEDGPDIDRGDAKKIADFQVDETVKTGETEWKAGTKAGRVFSLYNQDKEIQAYAVELKRGSEDAGYVVVGAEKENAPIIEFRTSGKFLDENLRNGEYLLYDGGINYYKVDEVTNQATSLDGSQVSVSVKDIPTVEDEPKGAAAEENKDEWNMLSNQARSSGGGSTPPTEKKQGDITDPRKYETGYMSIDHQIAPDAALYEYYTMGGLSNKAGSCTPTAAVNLLKYYTLRKRLRRSLFILK